MDDEMQKLKEKNRYLQTIIGKRTKTEARVIVVLVIGYLIIIFNGLANVILLRTHGKCGKGVLTDKVIASRSRNTATRYYLEYKFIYNSVTYHSRSSEQDLSRGRG